MKFRKSLALIVLLVVPAMFATGGCSGPSLGDEEAIKLIRNGRGYPQYEANASYDKYTSDVKDDPAHIEMAKVLEMACVESWRTPSFVGHSIGYKAQGECLQYLKSATMHFAGRAVQFNATLTTAKIDISRVVDRRVDRQTGTVTVTFEETVTPTSYFLDLLSKFPNISVSKDSLKPTTRTGSAEFEKWEKGWRLK